MRSPSLPRSPLARLVLAGSTLVVALVAWGAWVEISTGTRLAERLMLAQAQSIADLVRESGTHGYDAYQRWEDEIAERLFDNARWVAKRDAARPWTSTELARLADEHRLGRINVFDAAGNKRASSRIEPEESRTPRHDPKDFIGPVLRGEVNELRIGFKQARFRGGHRFAVAVARPGGGAVVVNVFADSMRNVLDQVRPGHLVGALGTASGVRYVVLQHGDSVIAATPESLHAGSLPPVDDSRMPLARERVTSLGRVYEVVRAVDLPGVGRTTARIGLDAGPLDRTRETMRQRALGRALLVAVTLGLAVALLLIVQRRDLLAREVARMRGELADREAEVQRAGRLAAMGGLAAHVAHEIRNPLNTIHITVQELARDASLQPELRQRADDLRSESRRIESIVQQFLDLARPRRAQLVRAPLDAIVLAGARTAEPAYRAAGLRLETAVEPTLATLDPQFVSEILDNLLRNAREASPPGGHVWVRVDHEGGDARLTVEDEGPGVAPELRDRVFDMFFTTRPHGTGLGLSIVSRLAAAMGGGVRIEQRDGGGARVVVHLPRQGEAT